MPKGWLPMVQELFILPDEGKRFSSRLPKNLKGSWSRKCLFVVVRSLAKSFVRLRLDVTDKKSISSVVSLIRSREGRLDILVNK